MTHACHQLLGARSGRGREIVPGLPQIVEMHLGRVESDLAHRLSPQTLEVATQQPAAERSDEHQAVRGRLGEPLHVTAQLRNDSRGNRYSPHASGTLRILGQKPATTQFSLRPQHPHLTRVEVEFGPAERGELAEPKARERGHQDETSEPRADRVSDVEHLVDGQNSALGGLLLAGPTDTAGLRRKRPSSAAVCRMVCRSRYAFSAVD
jgi:hypothetical protein